MEALSVLLFPPETVTYRQVKMFSIKKHECAKQDMRWMCSELFAFPQMFFLNTCYNVIYKNTLFLTKNVLFSGP